MSLCLQDPRSGEVIERDLYVTRKGATPAAEGQMGLIPGSMGQPLFYTIVLKSDFGLVWLTPHQHPAKQPLHCYGIGAYVNGALLGHVNFSLSIVLRCLP